ncbi:MAG: hypothetical protein K2K58_08655 [Muribaculaceae bacterium]|nr:hypothetical protein [Muribaculaceae bacterium]
MDERSEKVRKLLGEIPPSLVRWGNAVLLIIFSLLLAAVLIVMLTSPGEWNKFVDWVIG